MSLALSTRPPAASPPERAAPKGLLGRHRKLSEQELSAVFELEGLCVAKDALRLKLEPSTLSGRTGNRFCDFTWRDGEVLVGFLGIYQWQPGQAELTGMVLPSHRRLGIFSAMFEAAFGELRRRATPSCLLVMDRSSVTARHFAIGRGASYDHSEHHMSQLRAPLELEAIAGLCIRPATSADGAFVRECYMATFGDHLGASSDLWSASGTTMQLIELHELPVGVLRIDRSRLEGERSAGIYGFGVMPEHQGRGIGRRALGAVTRSLRKEGIEQIHLEVAVSNDAALKVYESCGFDRVGTDDYYEIRTSALVSDEKHPSRT
ncbi:MAG: GNAT family N-acetyltransferase [Acidimicrobiales bacterium]